MPVIGGYAFDNTPWFDNQPDGLVYFGTVAYKYKGKMPENTSITIKEGTLALASGVFSGCWGLTSITIPNSVTSIGTYAFESCSGLTSIEIPNSVTSIGWFAFYGCTNLTSITIPISVTTIGIGAFTNCTSLSKVTSLIQVPFAIVNVFPNEVYENATLYVPLGTKESYLNTEGWNNFYNIVTLSGVQVAINETNFPDGNFRNYLLAQSYGLDGMLTDNEMGVTVVNVNNKGINSLTQL